MLTATYFDAQTRQHHPAKVWPQRTGLTIHIPGHELFWTHPQISRSHAGVPGKLILKHGDNFRPNTIETDEAEFVAALKQARIKVNYLPGSASRTIKKVVLWLLAICLLVLGLLVAAWVLLMPKITALVAKKVPRQAEQQLAKPMLRSFLAGEEVDSAKTIQINQFYRQHKIPVAIPVTITVVKSEVVNAFAIPGGELVVYTGLLNKLQHPGQLAALLGHEAGHVEHRHSLISLVRNLSGHLVLVLLLQDAGGIMAVLVERAEWLQQLAYSRELELEADNFGLETLQRNGYPAQHMAGLMQVLKDASPEQGMPDFLSTHPGADERILQVQEWAKNHPLQHNTAPPDSADYYWRKLKQ